MAEKNVPRVVALTEEPRAWAASGAVGLVRALHRVDPARVEANRPAENSASPTVPSRLAALAGTACPRATPGNESGRNLGTTPARCASFRRLTRVASSERR